MVFTVVCCLAVSSLWLSERAILDLAEKWVDRAQWPIAVGWTGSLIAWLWRLPDILGIQDFDAKRAFIGWSIASIVSDMVAAAIEEYKRDLDRHLGNPMRS